MPRTDSAFRVIAAAPERVYAALVDREALTKWLPPTGMTGRFDAFDVRVGGAYRMELSYEDPSATGKSGGGSDIVVGYFVELTPGVRVVQDVVFDSDDPALAGTMTMTWELRPVGGGTAVAIHADNVPDGISADEHTAGMSASLENLASFLADA